MAQTKDFYSISVAEAIRLACAEFAMSQEKLDIEVLATGSAGIFGLCRKRAHIRVSPKKTESESAPQTSKKKKPRPTSEQTGKKAAQSIEQTASVEETVEPAPRPAKKERKRPPRNEEKPKKSTEVQPEAKKTEEEQFEQPSDEVLDSVRGELSQLLQLMGFESDVSVGFAEGSVQCHISGAYEENVIGPEGRTLDSLQYLLRKMMSRDLAERMSIDLDAGNFRERRIEELEKKAVELAEQVKEDGKTQSIAALNPSERRVVHVALQDDKEIRSRSVGDGLFKKVLIYKPGKNRKSGSRRKSRQGGGEAAK